MEGGREGEETSELRKRWRLERCIRVEGVREGTLELRK